MNISMRNDYSYLFNSMNSKATSSNSMYGINLSDYASIKSGGYGKLMKAYYSSDISSSDDSKKSQASSQDILSKLTETKKTVATTEKAEADNKTDTVAATDAATTKVSSAKDYLDKILESSKQLYASTGAYTDASAAVAGATLDTTV